MRVERPRGMQKELGSFGIGPRKPILPHLQPPGACSPFLAILRPLDWNGNHAWLLDVKSCLVPCQRGCVSEGVTCA